MPPGRDSFRRNRVAPSGYSLAFLGVSGFAWFVAGAARLEFTVDSDSSPAVGQVEHFGWTGSCTYIKSLAKGIAQAPFFLGSRFKLRGLVGKGR